MKVCLLPGHWTLAHDNAVGAFCYRKLNNAGWRTADVEVPYGVRGVTVRMHYHQMQYVAHTPRTLFAGERTSSCVCTFAVPQTRSR